MKTIFGFVALLAMLVSAPHARAHSMPNSAIYLDFGVSSVAAELIMPLGELQYAAGPKLRPLGAYLQRHLSVRTADGRAWSVQISDIRTVTGEGPADLRVRLLMIPPPGASVRRFVLHYDAIIDRVPNHFALLFARADYRGGILPGEAEMIGGLQGPGAKMLVDRGAGSAWRGFGSAVRLGMRHIAEGHDHLLFLVALILPAPLLAGKRRWAGYGGLRHTARRLVAVVTAFTIGHSLTLIGGAFFGWRLPSQPVEIAIALSILVSAIHAWRPLFTGREAWIAGGFGLVHGLAFATLIAHFGLEPVQKAQAILGFNLGIELVQLAVVLGLLPALLLFARTPTYAPLRTAGALFAGVAAMAWIIERSLGVRNIVGEVIDTASAHAPWLLAALTVTAFANALLGRVRVSPCAEAAGS